MSFCGLKRATKESKFVNIEFYACLRDKIDGFKKKKVHENIV
jgi:hypothetical protein